MIIPRDFQKKIIEIHQEKGREWLQELQRVLDDFETRTGAALLEPFPISYHLAAPAVMENGTRLFLKFAFPALNIFWNWMLMEQLQPGFPISSLLGRGAGRFSHT
jgi:hypothetical protein